MPYSVGLYFDPVTDDFVRGIWQRLAEDGLADYYHVSNNRPHITLVLFNDTDPERVEPILRDTVESLAGFPLSFQQMGVFPGQNPVVFWAPVVTEKLLLLQKQLYERLAPFSQQPEFDFYKPNHWIPHCGLAMEIAGEELVPAIVQRCLAFPNPHTALAVEMGLISFRPVKELFTFSFGYGD